jgi:flagellar motor switch protein FliG
MRRMAALRPVTPAALKAIESEIHEALITQLERSPASEAYLRMADILNRMDPAQCDEVLAAIEDGRPEVAKSLRAMMFRFEDLTKLDAKGLAVIFDQVSAEHVVLALRGVEGPLVEMVLSSIASRTRRMVEHELQNPGDIDQRAVADARRRIADRAMMLLQKGDIALNASENAEA